MWQKAIIGFSCIIMLQGCSDSKIDSEDNYYVEKKTYENPQRQIQFSHLFCNERVIIEDEMGTILFDKIVTSPNCSHADSSENWYFDLPSEITVIKLSIPKHGYTQKVACEKNKSLSLYFHDGSIFEYRKGKDTILIESWEKGMIMR